MLKVQKEQTHGQQVGTVLLVPPRSCYVPCAHFGSFLPVSPLSSVFQVWGFACAYCRSLAVEEAPFNGFSPNQANTALREVMALLGHTNAELYRCQDLRRGHAEDQLEAGCGIDQILADGEWRSYAFDRLPVSAGVGTTSGHPGAWPRDMPMKTSWKPGLFFKLTGVSLMKMMGDDWWPVSP